jgi:hypothetical protein
MPDRDQSIPSSPPPPPLPPTTDREKQCAVQEIARMIGILAERLEEIAGALPEPPDAELMYNDDKPYSVSVDLRGAIECTVSDDLRPAVRRLEKTARATAETLRQDFEERKGER